MAELIEELLAIKISRLKRKDTVAGLDEKLLNVEVIEEIIRATEQVIKQYYVDVPIVVEVNVDMDPH